MKVTISIPRPSIRSFGVKGSTIPEVFEALNRNGFWGRYRSQEKADWSGRDGVNDRVKLGGAPFILLPDWRNYGKATKAEKKSWDQMMKALTKHENNHHDIFTDYAAEWKKEMERGEDLDDAAMQSAWDAFREELQKRQDAYDKRTNHGEKEGVVLEQP